ncbi:hypothetical protein ACFV6Z_07895 [Streptomyces sp. NPDC059818]|uniref:hypothetical protein n=1 Tax=Streptomyces sp. NPDC059818 TaxID=3346962 RepID=UPI00365B1F46
MSEEALAEIPLRVPPAFWQVGKGVRKPLPVAEVMPPVVVRPVARPGRDPMRHKPL